MTKNVERINRAQELLSGEYLFGYELEDGAIKELRDGKFIKQILVRPISKECFEELWQHGKKYCSKFVIYIVSKDVFCCRRPDMLNYETDEDIIYGQSDVIAAAKEYNTEVKKSLHYTEDDLEESMKNYKDQFKMRSQYAIDNLIEIAYFGDKRYNIRFTEC